MTKDKKENGDTETSHDNSEAKQKKCFVIMPIADNPDYDPGHFNRVYEFLIKPACIEAGYVPKRADDTKSSNMIMLDVLRNIIECDMAICDLSSINANVFYELGLRQAFDKKTILIRDGKHGVPFDLLGFRYINYTPSLRVDTVKKEISEIAEMMQETQNAQISDANSIVSILKMKPATIDTKNLNAEESLLLQIMFKLNSLESQVKKTKNLYSYSQPYHASNNKNDYLTFINSPIGYLDEQLETIKNNIESKTIPFDVIMEKSPNQIANMLFAFQGRLIGHFNGVDDKGNLIFVLNGNELKFPDTEEVRKHIVY